MTGRNGHDERSAANGYGRLYDHLDATNGRAIGALIGHRKEPAETIAHRLEIRARILWDMAWAVGQGGPGIPVMRQRNVEWAANNLEAAAACIRRLGNFIPRTAKDAVNEEAVEKMALALKMIRDGDHGESYSAGVAMSALASVEEMGLDV